MSNLFSAVRENHQKAFELLISRKEISRVDIARELSVSLQTAMKIMQYFTDYELAECIGEGNGNLGRKPQLYAFKPDSAYIVAAVHEGDIVRVGVLDAACKVLAEQTQEIHSGMHDWLVKQPCDIAERLLRGLESEGRGAKRLIGAGLCLPGVVDDIKNEISFAPSFALSSSYYIGDLIKETKERLGAPVYIENDVNAAAYGEFFNTGAADLAYIFLGAGLGMGIVLDGNLRRGPGFSAGEIGYMPLADEFAGGQLREAEELIGLESLRRRFGLERHFGVSRMNPETKTAMTGMISNTLAQIIAATTALVNINEFVLGGLTIEILGDSLIQETQRKVKQLSPFTTTVRAKSIPSPALIGAAKKVLDMQIGSLMALDSKDGATH